MASLGIWCGGTCAGLDHRVVNIRSLSDQKAGPRSLVIDGQRCRKSRSLISTSTTPQPIVKKSSNGRRQRNEVISRDKLDEWIRESVVDIVKNLRGAPLFLRLYTNDHGEAARFETEKAVVKDRWPILEDQWQNGATAIPEGIIFVQELEDDQDYDSDGVEIEDCGESSKAWGIVIQGRGVRGAPVCYLLKTSSAAELGLFCTHFCLVRVNNFRETTKSQLQNCWLMQYQ